MGDQGPVKRRGAGQPSPRSRAQVEEEELLGSVLHDLCTPLVAIQGFVRLLDVGAAGEPLQGKQRAYLQQIEQAAEGMKRLVEKLQTARRLERGQIVLQPRPVELGSFCEQEWARHREAGQDKEVTVVREQPEPSLLTVVFDPALISQAFGHLVEDAIHHTPGRGEVREGSHVGEGVIRFWVEDQGTKIDDAALPRLFERSVQGSRGEGKGKGSGVGLFISQRIAELHHGRVTAENLTEGGSRLVLEIPLVPVPHAHDSAV